MAVAFEIPHALCRLTDDETEVVLEGATVADVLEQLWRRFPELRSRILDRGGRLYPYLLLMHNETKLPREGLETVPVADGDRLELVALAEGG